MPMVINRAVKIETGTGVVIYDRDVDEEAIGQEAAADEIVAAGAASGDREDVLDGLVAGAEYTLQMCDQFNYCTTTIRWYWRGRKILNAKKGDPEVYAPPSA